MKKVTEQSSCFSIRISESMRKELEVIAELEGRSLNNVIVRLLQKGLKEYER